jgi:hypothetical protein
MAEASAPAQCPQGHDDTVKLLSTVSVGSRAGWRGQSQQSAGWRGQSQQSAGWRGQSQQSAGWRGQSQQSAGGGGCCGGACGCR